LKAQKETCSSTSLLDSIIEQSPCAMWISDASGTLIRLNQACRDLLHLSDEEVVGKYNVLEDNIVAEQGLLPLVKRVFEQGETVEFTIKYDSSRLDHLELEHTVFRILDVTIAPVKDETDQVTNAVIMHKDVTDYRQTEAALTSSREQLEMIVNTLPVLLAYVDAEQRYLYVNPPYADWYGLPKDEIIGKHVRDVLQEDTYQRALPAIEAALSGHGVAYENTAYDTQGQPRTVKATYMPHLDADGQAKAFLATVEDVTERKRVERRIEDLSRFPAENPNPVLRVSGEGAILYANEASASLLKGLDNQGGQCLPDEWREVVSRSLARNSRERVEVSCRGHTLILIVAPVTEEGYANIYGLDITARKQAEERIKHLNAVLRAIRNVNQLIVQEKDSERLLQGVCNSLIATRGYYSAWIAFLDESGVPKTIVEAGLGESFPSLVERLERGESTYCTRKALAQESVLVIGEPASTCAECLLSNGYESSGGMAIRLEHAGEVYGLLVVSTALGAVQDEEEQGLFAEVAADIALALHSIALEKKREQAEKALRSSQRQLVTLMSNLPGMAYRCLNKPNWPIDFMSEGCLALTGYTPADFTSNEDLYQDLIHPQDRQTVWDTVQKAVQARKPFVIEYRLRDREGEEHWVWEQGQVIGEAGDGAAVLEGFVSDITGRKRTEEALQQHTRALALINQAGRAFSSTLDPNRVFESVLEEARCLLDIAASSIWLVDPETKELVCRQATGPRYESVIGWRLPPGEGIAGWVATHGESLIVPDVEKDKRHSAEVNEHIGLTVRSILSVPLRTQDSVIGVLQMLDVQPERFDVQDLQILEPLAASAAVAIENARLYQRAQQEIEERKRAEEALASERTVLRTLIDLLPEVVYIKDLEGRKTLANYVDLQYMGVQSEAEALGKTDFDFYPKEAAAKFRADDQAVLQAGESVLNREESIVRSDGEQRWLLTSKVPLRDENGQVTGLVGVGRDITERKQAEAALQRYVERLRILRAIDSVILAAQSPQEIGQTVLRHLQGLVPSDRVLISSFDLENEKAIVLASFAGDEMWLEPGTQIELEAFGNIANLQRGRVSIAGDAPALAETSLGQFGVLVEGIRSYIHIPLVVQSGLVGSILLAAEHPAAFTTEHVEVAGELSGQLAIGIHQARLHEQIQRYAQELEQQVTARTAQLARRTTQLRVAAEVARDAITAHDLDELLDQSVNLVRDRFGFYHAGLFLIDESGEYAFLRAATGEAGRQMLAHGHRLRVGEVGIVGHVCASGEPRIALDVGADAVYFDNPALPGTRSEMALPMRVGSDLIGALDVQSTKETAFDQEDVEIMQVMADQLAVAIERTRLFEQVQATLEEQLRTVVSHIPVMLFALDHEGVFTLAEGKGLEALGITPANLLGHSLFEVYEDANQVLDAVRDALAGEASALTAEVDGVTLDAWCSPLQDADGQVTGVLGVAVDVTERRRMQEQMQQHERLAAVGQLAGGIAHDFNNFLMTIVFYAHLLLRDKHATPDIVSVAETIVGEANRAADLVRQVLDFSRRSVMETQPVDLAAFVEEVMDILQKTLPENIRVVMETDSDDYTVEIDPTRIQQVIMNLALNSRDAMPSGGQLRIGLSRVTVGPEGLQLAGISDTELATGDWVRLSVEDTGVGMDEHVRTHLFEPFFTTKGPKGNGLGLAQVYGIVKQHRGEIGVETELGRGTAFQIYLPAYTKSHQLAESEKESTIPEGQGETILFIEDEDKVRDAGERVLRSLGYRVLTASNGREGVEVFRKTGQVDLVLTDMVMPEMGGREVIERLKQIAPDLKALVITGYTMQEDVQALKDAGFADIVYKPLDVGVLSRTIRRVLDSEIEGG
jgi:PAS domain S-box-containing protein